jgi:hypothetical protein
MTTDEFLEKYDKELLTFIECKELSVFLDFQSTENSSFTDIENSYGYQIFKIIIFNKECRYFLQFQRETQEYRILELKYKYPIL